VKRQNKNRALSRERQRTGETYFHWHLTAPDKAQNLTVEEESVRRDVIVNPWWITEAYTSEGSQETCVPDEWRPKSIPLDVRYSTPEDDQKARRWLSETRSGVMSGCDVGRTADRDLTVIGSTEPWNTVYTYRDVPHCAMESLTSMESFVLLL
jgi:transposase